MMMGAAMELDGRNLGEPGRALDLARTYGITTFERG